MTRATGHFVDSRDFARIARAIRYIDGHYSEQPGLSQLAARAGLSEFHFNRLFRRWAGITPKQYLAFVTGDAARRALLSQPSVLDAAYSVGLSGPGRLHDLMVSLNAMTPGEWKSEGRGIAIRYGFSATPFGDAVLATTDRGVCHLSFVDGNGAGRAWGELQRRWPDAKWSHDDRHATEIAERIWRPVRSGQGPLTVHARGTNFQLKVWQALLELEDRSTTYGELAGTLGSPSASRAVGHAIGANNVAWLIPCHSVLRKSGALGGYRWGEDRKRAMLAWRSMPVAARNM